MRSIFDWSYPPGAASDPNAPWNQEDPPCEVCGSYIDSCVCPECTVCGSVGDPRCTTQHGQALTEAQKASMEAAKRRDEEEEARLLEAYKELMNIPEE